MIRFDDSMFFDIETLSLNPYRNEGIKISDSTLSLNPDDNKIVLSQIGYIENNELKIKLFKEWEIGEENLIAQTIKMLRNNYQYSMLFTYNGSFDLLYLLGRMKYYDFDDNDLAYANRTIHSHLKHCDLIQYNSGYFMTFDAVCNRYGILAECEYNGSQISQFYKDEEYCKIESHGIDDVKRLYYLTTETKLADRFYKNKF